MNARKIPVNDVRHAMINEQRILSGTASDLQAGAAFFVCQVIGTAVVIKDGDGNTLMTTDTVSLDRCPLRCENGVDISSGTILYCVIPYGHA
jgi:hypothetical protein